MRKYNIDILNSYAFGDSGNDIDMLYSVKNGYLVSNASYEIKKLFPFVSPYRYSKAINYTILEISELENLETVIV
jgi:kanosamine-6-phosphate phosphatase